jgi:hypothetical protein
LSTILALESLQTEISFMAQNSIDEGREHLNDLKQFYLLLTGQVEQLSEEITW